MIEWIIPFLIKYFHVLYRVLYTVFVKNITFIYYFNSHNQNNNIFVTLLTSPNAGSSSLNAAPILHFVQ